MSVQYKAFQTTEETDAWVEKYKSFFPSDTDADKIFIQAIDYYTDMLKPTYNNHLRQHFLIKEDNFFYPYMTRMVKNYLLIKFLIILLLIGILTNNSLKKQLRKDKFTNKLEVCCLFIHSRFFQS